MGTSSKTRKAYQKGSAGYEKAIDLIEGLDDGDIARLAHLIPQLSRFRVKKIFKKGSLVVFKKGMEPNGMPPGTVARVDQVNRKSVSIDAGKWNPWNVSPTVIEAAPPGSKVEEYDDSLGELDSVEG